MRGVSIDSPFVENKSLWRILITCMDRRRPVGPRAGMEGRRVRVTEGAAGLHHVRPSLCGGTATRAGEARQASVFEHLSHRQRSALASGPR